MRTFALLFVNVRLQMKIYDHKQFARVDPSAYAGTLCPSVMETEQFARILSVSAYVLEYN